MSFLIGLLVVLAIVGGGLVVLKLIKRDLFS